MYRTLKTKLDRSNELAQTVRIWNAACQAIIDYGFAAHDYNKTSVNSNLFLGIQAPIINIIQDLRKPKN